MKINRTGIRELFLASTDTAALTNPVPTATKPTSAGDTPATACEQSPAMKFTFAGTDAANETVNYQIISWVLYGAVYVPRILAKGVFTLGSGAMTVDGLDTAATLFADTITDTIGRGGVVVTSFGNNTTADITVFLGSAEFVTVEIDADTATSASCYWEIVDELTATPSTINGVARVRDDNGLLEAGIVTAGGATTLTDSTKKWATNDLRGCVIRVTSGTGDGGLRVVLSNTPSTITVLAWGVAPVAGDSYAIYPATTVRTARTLTDCRLFVGSAGTAEALFAAETFCCAVYLQAKKAAADNTGNVFLGLSDVVKASLEYIELAPGDYWEPHIPDGVKIDLATVYIDADTTAEGVVGMYIPA